jgi:hypothetical protein
MLPERHDEVPAERDSLDGQFLGLLLVVSGVNPVLEISA